MIWLCVLWYFFMSLVLRFVGLLRSMGWRCLSTLTNFQPLFFWIFFSVPSSVLWGLQLCLNLAAWSCPTVHWCFVSFILFSGFHLGEFLLVYFQIHYFFSAALQFLSLEVWLEPLDFRCLYSTCSVFPLVPWVHGIIIPVFMCPSTNSIVCHFWIHFHWFVSSLQVIFRSTLCTW